MKTNPKPYRSVQVTNFDTSTISTCTSSAYTTPTDTSFAILAYTSPVYTTPAFLSAFQIIVNIYHSRSQFSEIRNIFHLINKKGNLFILFALGSVVSNYLRDQGNYNRY